MTIIHISEDDVQMALAELEGVERRHGSARAMELAAAQARANGAYLARWTGPSVAAEVLSREAHRLVAQAASAIAVPGAPSQSGHGEFSRKLARAASWSVGLLGGFLLGLGIAVWA